MAYSRGKNLKLNVLIGYLANIANIVLSFIGRKVFLLYLSTDYLGINGLFGNIFVLLSLAELGLDSAAVYSLYEPVERKDTNAIITNIHYFRKLYRLISVVMFLAGVALLPSLNFWVRTDIDNTEIIVYYIVFLLNNMISYWSADKVAFLNASQEQRISKLIMMVVQLLQLIVQILVIVLTKSYLVYILVYILTTCIYNIAVEIVCVHKYPYLRVRKIEINDIDTKPIIKRIEATVIYKIGAVIINNTDNILISIIVNTSAVGLYSNYLMVVNGFQGMIAIVNSSLMSGIGNLIAQRNIKRAKELFFAILLFYQYISVLGMLGLMFCGNDFITIIFGEKYCFSKNILMAISVNFLIVNIVNPVWMYREANGLFEQVKYLMLSCAAVNLCLSVFLGIKAGVFGILIATAISRIVTLIQAEPKILFRNVFNEETLGYWKSQLRAVEILMLDFLLCYGIIDIITDIDVFNIYELFIVKVVLILVIVSFTFAFLNHNRKEYKELVSFIGLDKMRS